MKKAKNQKTTTKTEEFESMEELKAKLKVLRETAQRAVNEYDALLIASLGKMPKTEEQLLDFIEKVLKHHEVIK